MTTIHYSCCIIIITAIRIAVVTAAVTASDDVNLSLFRLYYVFLCSMMQYYVWKHSFFRWVAVVVDICSSFTEE